VKVVTDHPELGVGPRHAAIDFHLGHDPKFGDLALDREGDELYSAYHRIPQPKDLLARSKLIETAAALGTSATNGRGSADMPKLSGGSLSSRLCSALWRRVWPSRTYSGLTWRNGPLLATSIRRSRLSRTSPVACW
jgi:hypothetical protein